MKNMYRLDAALDLVGGFWSPTDPDEITPGTLSSQSGRLHLLAAPTFDRLDDDDLKEALMSYGAFPDLKQINALCGLTKEGRCTLLNVTAIDDDGVTDIPNQVQISAARLRVGGVVMGLHLDSAEAESLGSAAFYFAKIHKWLPQAGSLQLTDESINYISPSKALQVVQFDSVALEAKIICEVFSRRMKSLPRVRIVPQRPQSLDWFVSLAPRLENFFTLLLGTSVSLKAVQLFQGLSDSGWLIEKWQSRREKVNRQSWVPRPGLDLAIALEKWLAIPEEQRSVERTVLNMVRKSSLFVETEFIALAQAMEGFGRLRFERSPIPKAEFRAGLLRLTDLLSELWGADSEITRRCTDALGHANAATFAQHIEQIISLLSSDFASKLLGDKAQFVGKVKQTRNYFTHLGSRKQTAVMDDGKELFLINQRLHALLRCVMLIDVGISEDVLRKPILYQATRWK